MLFEEFLEGLRIAAHHVKDIAPLHMQAEVNVAHGPHADIKAHTR